MVEALGDRVDDGLAVDRQIECPPQVLGLGQRRVERFRCLTDAVLVGHVDLERVPADPGLGVHVDVVGGFECGRVLGCDAERRVDVPGAQVDRADVPIRDDHVLHPVEGDVLGVVVQLRLAERQRDAGRPLVQLERCDADRLGAVVVAERVQLRGRGDHAGERCQRVDDPGIGPFEVEDEGLGVHRLDLLDSGEVLGDAAALELDVALDGVLGGFGVERLTVVEDDPGTQWDGHRQTVVGDLRIVGGQLRDRLHVGVHRVQAFTDRQQHLVRGLERLLCRIQRVGLGVETDLEDAARFRRSGVRRLRGVGGVICSTTAAADQGREHCNAGKTAMDPLH